jgi:hypothetical protein
MTTAALGRSPVLDSPTFQNALLDVVHRARGGDTDALAYVFDNVFYDVYHHVFLMTRDRSKAERATRKALDRLPEMLRGQRYATVAQIRDVLVYEARQTVRPMSKAGASAGGMDGLRAVVRHLVLISTAAIAAASALILAL